MKTTNRLTAKAMKAWFAASMVSQSYGKAEASCGSAKQDVARRLGHRPADKRAGSLPGRGAAKRSRLVAVGLCLVCFPLAVGIGFSMRHAIIVAAGLALGFCFGLFLLKLRALHDDERGAAPHKEE